MTYYFSSPYNTAEGTARAGLYGFDGTPSTMFDGSLASVGGGGGGSLYSNYQPKVAARLAAGSPLVMTADYVIEYDEVVVSCTIHVESAVSGANAVQFLVCQDGLHDQSNMVVDLLPAEPFALTAPGQSVTIERRFVLQPDWTEPDLNVIVLVQAAAGHEVLQAVQAVPAYAGTVTVDCEPDGVQAGWQITGPLTARSGSGDDALNLFFPGKYAITWEDLPYWAEPTPNPQLWTVSEGGAIAFAGAYTDGPFTVRTDGAVGHVGAGRGAGLIDVDHDGDLDIHVIVDGAADQLLLNDGTCNFTDVAAGPLADTGAGRAAAWADFNGDGFLDVYLTRQDEANLLLKGDGTGAFRPAVQYGADNDGPGAGANWVDYDLDGDLDLYVVLQGQANLLLTNTAIAGEMFIYSPTGGPLAHTGMGRSATWIDLDLDGRPDPYLVNGFQANALFQNFDYGFADVSSASNVADTGNGRAAAWGDFDNDGDFDLYVANDGMADKLYRCTSPFRYSLVDGPNLGDRGHARSVAWTDFDNDTHLDLYIARFDEPDIMLLGDGTGSFQKVPAGLDETYAGSQSVAIGDLDDDGSPDLFLSRDGAANAVMLNGLVTGNRWFKLRLAGSGLNTAAIGARVVLTSGGVSQMRMISSGTGYLGQDAFEMHFGLGADTLIDQIDIYWPSELHQVVGPKPTNTTLTVVEGQNPASPVGGDMPVPATQLGRAHPNPFNPATKISFALGTAGPARLDVYTVDGRHVRSLVNADLGAGPHDAIWQGRDDAGREMASGTYLYRLRTGNGFSRTGRMSLVK